MATELSGQRRSGIDGAEQGVGASTLLGEESNGTSAVGSLVRSWLPLTIFVALIIHLGIRASGPITDPDTWWHLRLGQEFRGNWNLSAPGSLSPFADQPWVATQWSLELVANYLVGAFGLGAAAWLTGIAAILLGVTLWLGNRSRSGPLAASVATSAAMLGALPVLAPRPQVASLVLLAIVTGAWLKSARDLRPRWWLVPLGWVWACTHGFWFVGVLVGFAVVAGLVMDRRLEKAKALSLLSIPAGSLLVAAATPIGPRLLLAPFRVNGVADRIQEWQPPNFQEPTVLVVGLMLAGVMLTYARRGSAPWAELALVAVAAMFLVYAARSVALAAVLLGPLLASTIQGWGGSGFVGPSRSERWFVGSSFALALVALSVSTALRAPYSHPYPKEVDEALAGLPEGTVVYNDYAYGGWLSWEHQHLVHGIDGLAEAYSPEYIDAYSDAGRLLPGWRDFLENEVDADAAFLPVDQPLALELSTHEGWSVLARTEEYVVLVRP